MFFQRGGGERGKSSSASTFVFASFFGALFIAAALAYNDYRFSKFNLIDFSEIILYTQDDIFVPNRDRYQVVVFSSNMRDYREKIEKMGGEYPILAIDLYQKRDFERSGDILYVSSGMSMLLKFIQRFNIYEVPVTFVVERYRGKIYKQQSSVKTIEF